MFAFALFDERSARLVLARDQMGIKPLYYLRRGAGLVFASELKAVVAAVGKELEVDRASMVASILYYWVPDQRCSIKGVEKLPPGTWAEVAAAGRRGGPAPTGVSPRSPPRRRRRDRSPSGPSSNSRSPPTSSPTCRCRAS